MYGSVPPLGVEVCCWAFKPWLWLRQDRCNHSFRYLFNNDLVPYFTMPIHFVLHGLLILKVNFKLISWNRLFSTKVDLLCQPSQSLKWFLSKKTPCSVAQKIIWRHENYMAGVRKWEILVAIMVKTSGS